MRSGPSGVVRGRTSAPPGARATLGANASMYAGGAARIGTGTGAAAHQSQPVHLALPVRMSSGWLRPEVMREVEQIGSRLVVGKPFAPFELAAAIPGVLHGAGPGAL